MTIIIGAVVLILLGLLIPSVVSAIVSIAVAGFITLLAVMVVGPGVLWLPVAWSIMAISIGVVFYGRHFIEERRFRHISKGAKR